MKKYIFIILLITLSLQAPFTGPYDDPDRPDRDLLQCPCNSSYFPHCEECAYIEPNPDTCPCGGYNNYTCYLCSPRPRPCKCGFDDDGKCLPCAPVEKCHESCHCEDKGKKCPECTVCTRCK